MWILPNNHPLRQSLSDQAFVALKEELSQQVLDLNTSLFWRSKPLSLKIWFQKWSRVYWIRLLFGRTVKHSHHTYFEEKLTSYFQGIHANLFPLPANEPEQKTLDTYIPTLPEQLTLFDPTAVSLKTSVATLPSDSEKSLSRWKEWVTECVGEYSVLRQQAQAIREKEFLSWQSAKTSWPTITVKGNHNRKGLTKTSGDGLATSIKNWTTPVATDSNRETQYQQGGTALSLQVKTNWPTPRVFMYKDSDQDRGKSNLGEVVSMENWGTPTSRDYKDGTAESVKNVPENGLLGRMIHSPENQLHDPDKFSTDGSDPEQFRMLKKRLSPHWVAQLMNTDSEKIFFVHLEIPSTQKPQL